MSQFSVRVVEIQRVSTKPLKVKTVAPLSLVLFLGFLLSTILLALSIWLDDGSSLLATLLLSFLSTIIGLGNKWTLHLPERKVKASKVPRGDVVVRYPKGSFLIVKCDEDVARELYFAPETIRYLIEHAPAYRLLSLVGSLMLMGGVIALANAKIQLQVAWAGSYMVLGSGYWVVAALPSKLHWDTSAYHVALNALADSDPHDKGLASKNTTFTQALWRAIAVTKDNDWIMRSGAAPNTASWRRWLHDARHIASSVRLSDRELLPGVRTWAVPKWDPQAHLNELMQEQAEVDEKGIAVEGV